MNETLSYQCPHCQHVVNVSAGVIGETVECPDCERQFQANAPLGKPVRTTHTPVPGEKVVDHEANGEQTLRTIHPVAFRNHLLLTTLLILAIVGGLAGLIAALASQALLGLEGATLLTISSVLLGVGVLYGAYRWVAAMATTLTITSRRTILSRGILSKDTNEVQHDDVRNMKSDRNIFERMFNYGDVAISSSGQDDMEIVAHDIPDPQGVLEIIRQHQ